MNLTVSKKSQYITQEYTLIAFSVCTAPVELPKHKYRPNCCQAVTFDLNLP